MRPLIYLVATWLLFNPSCLHAQLTVFAVPFAQPPREDYVCLHFQRLVTGTVYAIESPGFPLRYQPGEGCQWSATAVEPTARIILDCYQFELPSPKSGQCADALWISLTGRGIEDDGAAHCGKGPFTVVSEGPSINAVLKSDADSPKGGRFKCTIAAVPAGSNVTLTRPPPAPSPPLARPPPEAKPQPARPPPDARPQPARPPPDARPQPARPPPDARPQPARPPPDARPQPARPPITSPPTQSPFQPQPPTRPPVQPQPPTRPPIQPLPPTRPPFQTIPPSRPEEQRCDCGISTTPREIGNAVRIYGGREAGPHEFPFVAALLRASYNGAAASGDRFLCGATILSTRAALSAAHCVEGVRANDLILLAGESNRGAASWESWGQSSTISRLVIHPEFSGSWASPNLVVAFLNDPLRLGPAVGTVCLPPPSYIDDSLNLVDVFLVGWGSQTLSGPTSQKLRVTHQYVVPVERCKAQIGPEVSEKIHLCTLKDDAAACKGDPGGPILWRSPRSGAMQVVGVLSHGRQCANNAAGLSTRIAPYVSWIRRTLGEYLCTRN